MLISYRSMLRSRQDKGCLPRFACPHCQCGAAGKGGVLRPLRPPHRGLVGARPAASGTDEAALPGSDEATRQMAPTPSLLRAAAVSVKRGAGRPAPRSRLPLALAMLAVAVAGGVGGFFVVRAGVVNRRPTAPGAAVAPPGLPTPAASAPAAPVPTIPTPAAAHAPAASTPPGPTPRPPAASAPANKTLVRKNRAGKRAHVIASAPVAVKARKTSSGGLPHKQVATDSKPLHAADRTTRDRHRSGPRRPGEADDKQEAQAGVDADSVRLVVRQHLPQVRACYGRAFKDSSPGGAVEIGFAIDPAGRARNVRTETNTTDSEGLAHCLEQRVREWQFPRPVGGDYELIYPFVFTPGS